MGLLNVKDVAKNPVDSNCPLLIYFERAVKLKPVEIRKPCDV
jgi:hypothetical protein